MCAVHLCVVAFSSVVVVVAGSDHWQVASPTSSTRTERQDVKLQTLSLLIHKQRKSKCKRESPKPSAVMPGQKPLHPLPAVRYSVSCARGCILSGLAYQSGRTDILFWDLRVWHIGFWDSGFRVEGFGGYRFGLGLQGCRVYFEISVCVGCPLTLCFSPAQRHYCSWLEDARNSNSRVWK